MEQRLMEHVIIGSERNRIMEMFAGWKRDVGYERNVDPRAVKFLSEDLMVVVDFDSTNKAEGVAFLSMGEFGEDGSDSYVNRNRAELTRWAAGSEVVCVTQNVTTKHPVELFFGNLHG